MLIAIIFLALGGVAQVRELQMVQNLHHQSCRDSVDARYDAIMCMSLYARTPGHPAIRKY